MPGMLLEAKYKHNINMNNSWMIGDKEADIIAANNAGIILILFLLEVATKLIKLTRMQNILLTLLNNQTKLLLARK